MKIDIILPFKENFSYKNASAVSISIKNSLTFSAFKKNINIYGKTIEEPFYPENFIGIKTNKFLHLGNNRSLIFNYLKYYYLNKEVRLIEIHNRPNIFNIISNKAKSSPKVLYFHNDPTKMKGSNTVRQRVQILKKAAGVVFVSEFLKKKFLEGIQPNEKKLYVIPNSLNLKEEKTKKKQVLFVGRLVKEKGVELYVNAVKNLALVHKNWEFIMIGNTMFNKQRSNKNFINDLIAEFKNIGNNVYFYENIPNSKVMDFMSEASILVVPSLWEEPFGLTALEGISNKMVVIASKTGGLKEVVKNRGILIDDINEIKITNTINKLIYEPQYLNQIKKQVWKDYYFEQEKISKLQDDIRKKIYSEYKFNQ